MNRKQRKFIIVLDMPQRTTQSQVRWYILDAIRHKAEQVIEAHNPMSMFDITSVHIENGD